MVSCGGCFGFLGGGGDAVKMSADPQPRRGGNEQVASLQEAMKLERGMQGSFMPSPARSGGSRPWASPAPYSPNPNNSGGAEAIDLEMVISEFGVQLQDGPGPLASQLDTDRPGRMQVLKGGPRQTSRFEMEQMVASPGSLPRPMTGEEREAAIRKLVPTATYQMLAKVPEALLLASNSEGQLLRRKLAKGATLVVVSAGLPGKRFTLERAAALGIKIVIIEHPDSWSSVLVSEGVAAKFIPVDMSQSSDEVFKQILKIIQDLGEDGKTGSADGIATFVELSVPLVARLTEAMGLPGHRPAAVDGARNKHETRRFLKNAGLPTPRNLLLLSFSDLAAGESQVGFPAVLKPVSGAASLGVKRVNNRTELATSYTEVINELKTLVVSCGALVQGTGDHANGLDASKMVDLTVLMEQYLDGPEVDVDVVMSRGDWVYAAVADNGPTMEPYFNETWGLCPSLLPKDQQRELKELSVSIVKALGFTAGVFHVECKMTSTGPQLIEVNARMGGGQVHECNLRCWGVDLVEETLFAALGIPARPAVPKQPMTSVAYCYVNAPHSGKVTDLSKLEQLQMREDVVWAKPLVKPGMEVTGPEKGLPTWLCDLFVTKPDAKEALEFLQKLEAEIPVPVVQ